MFIICKKETAMQKILIIFFTVCLLLGLTACKANQNPVNKNISGKNCAAVAASAQPVVVISEEKV
jgi:hypothetical protein